MNTTARRRAALVVALATAALVLPSPLATPVSADPSTSREEIYETLEVRLDEVAAHYVILVDTSGSMAYDAGQATNATSRYSKMAEALPGFLERLGNRDTVSLYTFNDVTSQRYEGDANDVASILAALPPAPDPTPLASDPAVHTDIGRALERGLSVLDGDTSEVRAVILISDGQQDPSAGSVYDASGTSPAWATLRERAAAMDQARRVDAYALEVGTSTAGTALGWVFQDPTVLRADSPDLIQTQLDRAKTVILDAKIANLLNEDRNIVLTACLPQQPDLDLGSGKATIDVDLTSTAQALPLSTAGLSATLRGLPNARVSIDLVEIPAASTTRVQLSASWDPPGWFSRTAHAFGEIELVLSGMPVSPWASYLQQISAPFEARLAGSPLRIGASTGFGPPLAILMTGLALVTLAGVALWWARTRPAASGTIMACHDPDGATFGEVRISGWRTRLNGSDGRGLTLRGKTSVRRRRPGNGVDRDSAPYTITFDPSDSPGHPDSGTCDPNSSVLINGMRFCHVADGADNPTCRCWQKRLRSADQ